MQPHNLHPHFLTQWRRPPSGQAVSSLQQQWRLHPVPLNLAVGHFSKNAVNQSSMILLPLRGRPCIPAVRRDGFKLRQITRQGVSYIIGPSAAGAKWTILCMLLPLFYMPFIGVLLHQPSPSASSPAVRPVILSPILPIACPLVQSVTPMPPHQKATRQAGGTRKSLLE